MSSRRLPRHVLFRHFPLQQSALTLHGALLPPQGTGGAGTGMGVTGLFVGISVGLLVGTAVGGAVGFLVGGAVGLLVGGAVVGVGVGDAVTVTP